MLREEIQNRNVARTWVALRDARPAIYCCFFDTMHEGAKVCLGGILTAHSFTSFAEERKERRTEERTNGGKRNEQVE